MCETPRYEAAGIPGREAIAEFGYLFRRLRDDVDDGHKSGGNAHFTHGSIPTLSYACRGHTRLAMQGRARSGSPCLANAAVIVVSEDNKN